MTEAEIESMKNDICRAIDMTPLSFSYDQANECLKKAIPDIIDVYITPKPIEWEEEEKERMLTIWEKVAENIGKVADKIGQSIAEQKKARWFGIEYDGYADGNPVYDVWECSCCHEEYEGDFDSLPNYCSNCGAKMEEENEGRLSKKRSNRHCGTA